jgi:hypothetical protein
MDAQDSRLTEGTAVLSAVKKNVCREAKERG